MNAPAPLEGIRVVDLTHLIAGPFCTMLLADNGADVVKVEPPDGDISRARAPHKKNDAGSVSGYFLAMNRGKRSVVLNLKTAGGRSALQKLIEKADVLIENYRPGVLAKLGFDPGELARQHPSLIVASVSGYGSDRIDPVDRDRPGVAIVAEAVSGLTLLARDRAGNPTWVGFPLGDLVAGLTAYAAITTALVDRQRSGRGRRLDLAMSDSMLSLNSIGLANYALTGRNRREAVEPLAIPFGVFPAADGHVVIGVNSDAFWRRLCEAMGQPELGSHPDFAVHSERSARAAGVEAIVTAWTSPRPRSELVEALHAAGVPCSVVADVDDILDNSAYRSRGVLWDVDDGLGGKAVLPGSAMGMADSPAGPVPRLGQHTREVLGELGIDPERVRELEQEGAVVGS